jgi:hypothetical protein
MNTGIDGDLRKIHKQGSMKTHPELKLMAVFSAIRQQTRRF